MTERTMQEEQPISGRGQHIFKTSEAVPVAFQWRDELATGRVDLKDHLINTSTWAVANALYNSTDLSLCVQSAEIGRDYLTTRARLVGGRPGSKFVVTNTIVTTGGKCVERAVIVACGAS